MNDDHNIRFPYLFLFLVILGNTAFVRSCQMETAKAEKEVWQRCKPEFVIGTASSVIVVFSIFVYYLLTLSACLCLARSSAAPWLDWPWVSSPTGRQRSAQSWVAHVVHHQLAVVSVSTLPSFYYVWSLFLFSVYYSRIKLFFVSEQESSGG